jgi:hypothetical protein
MILTVAELVSVLPSVALQVMVKTVWELIGGETQTPPEHDGVAALELMPVHDAPLLLVTVHDVMLVVLHETFVVAPLLTRSGVTLNVMLAVGGGLHAPLEQP